MQKPVSRINIYGLVITAVIAGLAIIAPVGDKATPVDDCVCGGCGDEQIDNLVFEAGSTHKYFIGPGTMSGIDRATTVRLIREGAVEFDQTCGVDLVESDKESGSRLRIVFNPKLGSLGRYHSSGKIELNSSEAREVPNLEKRRVLQALICHEFGHYYGLKNHDNRDRKRIMHEDLGYHWSPSGIEALQRRHGKPEANDDPYLPTLRKEIGDKLRAETMKYKADRGQFEKMLAQRNEWKIKGNWSGVRSITPRLERFHKMSVDHGNNMAELSKEWWAENKKWNTSKVQGFVRLGN